jgi:uncharacterized protein
MGDVADEPKLGHPTRQAAAIAAEFAQSVRDDFLQLVILPTEKCNFRCTYCYEDFVIGRMSDETVGAVEAFLAQRVPRLRRLFIEWFGGEPLLARDVIWRLSQTAIDLCARVPTSVEFAAGITTNGWYLDVPTGRKLVEHHVTRAQVSLDGPRSLHDATRKRLHGEGTFERIHANLQALLGSSVPLEVLLRVHLTPENAPAMGPFVEELAATYLGDERFSLLLTPVGHLGGPNDAEFSILGGHEASRLISDLASIADSRTIRGKADRVDLVDANPTGLDVCYAAKPNSLVVRADGRLAKCTVALSNSHNDIGRINPDGTLSVFNEKLGPWMRGWFTGDTAALACPLERVPELEHPGKRLLPLLAK